MTPIDPLQCQAEHGGAFTLGPGLMRCQKVPTVVVTEVEVTDDDGELGSMSLCDACLAIFKERGPTGKFLVWKRDEVIENKVKGIILPKRKRKKGGGR